MIELVLILRIRNVWVAVSHLAYRCRTEDKSTSDVPQESLHPQTSPDIADTKRTGNGQIQTPEGLVMRDGILSAVGREGEWGDGDRRLVTIELDSADTR